MRESWPCGSPWFPSRYVDCTILPRNMHDNLGECAHPHGGRSSEGPWRLCLWVIAGPFASYTIYISLYVWYICTYREGEREVKNKKKSLPVDTARRVPLDWLTYRSLIPCPSLFFPPNLSSSSISTFFFYIHYQALSLRHSALYLLSLLLHSQTRKRGRESGW